MYATSNNSLSYQPTDLGREPSIFSLQNRPPQQEAQQQLQQQFPQQSQAMPSHKSPKVRTSCDPCASAKVRCSKEHPRCERCIESNFPCIYGLSMKHGKGSQKRRQPEIQPASVTMPSEQIYSNDLQQSFSDLLESIGGTDSISSIQPWPSSNDVATKHRSINSTPHVPASPVFNDPFLINAMANGNADTRSNETMSPTSHGPAISYLENPDDNLPLLLNTEFSHSINSEPFDAMSSPSSSASSVTPTPLLQPQTSNGSGTHDCYVIANSTLAMLHVSSRPFSSDTGSDAMSTLSPNSTTCVPMQIAQNLDEVLCCTRKAMGNVLQLLRCPCASDSQMAMLYASIVIRILFWHQLAAGLKTSTSLPLPSWDGSQSTDPFATTRMIANRSQQSSCSTPSAFIASEPIKIGNYVADQEDQEPMRRLLLLISLQKLGRLIEIFAQVRDPVEAGTSQIRGVLASWLNLELHQTTKAVGKGAKAMVGQQS